MFVYQYITCTPRSTLQTVLKTFTGGRSKELNTGTEHLYLMTVRVYKCLHFDKSLPLRIPSCMETTPSHPGKN